MVIMRPSRILSKIKTPGNAVWIVIVFGFIFSVPAWMAGEGLSYNILLFTSSVLLLIKSADYLVSGSSRVASYFGVPSFIIGMTIVAFGTSLPELTVSAIANFVGSSGLSIGNVVGSNISNVCLVLGIAAILVPIKINRELFKFDVPFLLFVSMLLPILSLNMLLDLSGPGYVIGIVDGLLLIGLFVLFVYVQINSASENRKESKHDRRKVYRERRHKRLVGYIITLIAGLTGVIVSASLLVESGRGIARLFGIPEVIIGLTMVAVGTSLPELATNIVAALKKKVDIAIGNVIGSNVFNILLVIGASSVIRPIGNIVESTVLIDMPVMIGLTAIFVAMMKSGREISRANGIVLFMLYIVYIFYLFVSRI